MLRSLLLALDDTPGGIAARRRACTLARAAGASLTGVALLDRRHLFDPQNPERGPEELLRAARARNDSLLAALHRECPEASREVLDDAPEAGLRSAMEGHDLVVLGTDTECNGEACENGVSPLIGRLVSDGSRPLLAVPPDAPDSGPALVAYTASVAGQRSLHMALLLGLLGDAEVVSVGDDEAQGAAVAARATVLLRRHGVEALARGIGATHPIAAVMEEARRVRAGLLVIGAHAYASLSARGTSSATARLLRDAPCAVFLHH